MTQVRQNIDQELFVCVSGVSVNGNAATADFTSDAIPLNDLPWSVVFTFTSLTVTGRPPSLIIEGTNDPSLGANSWGQIPNGSIQNLLTEPGAKSRFSEYTAIRLVYSSNGATGGTLNVYMNQKMS